jgi:hypothetical protein
MLMRTTEPAPNGHGPLNGWARLFGVIGIPGLRAVRMCRPGDRLLPDLVAVCPGKAVVFSGSQSRRGKSQRPRSLDGRAEGNRSLEAHRQSHRKGWRASHRAATCVNAGPPPKDLSLGGRAHNHRAKAAWGVAVWLTRRTTPAGRERRHGDEDTASNWRNPPRPTAKAAAAAPPYNQRTWEVGGRREGDGWVRSSDEAG